MRLAMAVGAVAIVWLVVLPWTAGRRVVAEHIERLERDRIDPSAMYYTDLEMMEPIFTRLALEQRRR